MLALAGCGGDRTGNQAPSAAPVDPRTPPTEVVWTTFAGVPVPCAEQGPTDCYATAPSGYAHTGAGAALAAISATVRMSVAPDRSVATVVGTLVTPSEARDTWSVQRQRISITQPIPEAKAPAVLGYTIDSYTPERATVGIITRQHDGSLTRNTATVVWTAAGDWFLDLPATTDTRPRVQAITTAPADMIALPAR